MALSPRAEATAAVVALLICGAFIASFLLGLGGAPSPPGAADSTSPALVVPDRVVGRVEVLNASGLSGAARAATERLRSGGFDVVYFGNAPAAAGDSSRVLDRSGNTAVARAAARRLGITRVVTQRDSSLFVDATIVLGTDWRASADSAFGRTGGWRARVRRQFCCTRSSRGSLRNRIKRRGPQRGREDAE
jgi:LytR cell envelope-related transcriptional attenuator